MVKYDYKVVVAIRQRKDKHANDSNKSISICFLKKLNDFFAVLNSMAHQMIRHAHDGYSLRAIYCTGQFFP